MVERPRDWKPGRWKLAAGSGWIVPAVLMLTIIAGVRAQDTDDRPILAVAPIHMEHLSFAEDQSAAAELRKAVLEAAGETGEVILLEETGASGSDSSAGWDTLNGCISLECLQEYGRFAGADLVLGVSLSGEARFAWLQYEVRLVSMAEGRVMQRELGESMAGKQLPKSEIAEASARAVRMQLSPRGVLNIDTIPAESAVLLNGEPVGFAPVLLERPSGLTDTVRAIRQGYLPEVRAVKLKAGETRDLLLKMRSEAETKVRGFPPVHVYGIGGVPLNQASSNLDSRLTWGGGRSWGVRIDDGAVWRIGLGFHTYEGRLENLEEQVVENAGVLRDPDVFASAIHSNLYYYPGNERMSPYLGVGLSALQRSVTQEYSDRSETRRTDYETAWMLMIGLEIRIYGPIQAQLELMHTRTLAGGEPWRRQDDSEPSAVLWDRSFTDFSSFTMLRFAVGYSF